MRNHSEGTAFAIGAYLIWGMFPIYWKQLDGISALQLIAHRIAWSFALLGILVLGTRSSRTLLNALDRRAARTYLGAAVLISVNWFAYVWAVTHGLIVEASLGYFINPLLSVLLGVILFGERLRLLQWLPLGIAALAVAYLTITLGSFPWLAVLLAVTFGLYGAMKKTAPLGAMFGLAVETGILFLPAVGYLVAVEVLGTGAFFHGTPQEDLLMIGAGIVTAVPLLLFAAAVTRVSMTTIGILQYLTPTMQFLIGIAVYDEPFPKARLIGFSLVWVGLALFWIEGIFARRSLARAQAGGS